MCECNLRLFTPERQLIDPPPLVGVVHADLKLFLETNLPVSGKKKAALGVSDAKIGAALQEEFNLSIQTGGVVAEISRGKTDASSFFVEAVTLI